MSALKLIAAISDPSVGINIKHCSYLENRSGWVGIDEILREHLLIVVESGVLDLGINEDSVLLKAGQVCWLFPGTRRKLSVPEQVHVSRNWRLRFTVNLSGKPCTVKGGSVMRGDGSALIPYMLLMRETLDNPALSCERKPLLQGMLWRMNSLRSILEERCRMLDFTQRRRVESLVQREILNGVRTTDMANAAGLSADYFSRVFHNTYKISPRRYLLEQRMRLAGDILLDSVLSVQELCYEIGDSDPGTFCRQFKKIMGCTPTEYRHKYGAVIKRIP